MARVVLQVLVHRTRITFRWSEADNSFEPYFLEKDAVAQFWQAVEQSQACLRDLVATENSNSTALALARAGGELYRRIFAPEQAAAARDWLRKQYDAGTVDSLEIVGDTLGRVPWNIVFEGEPDEAAFREADEFSECWASFWGIRYNLAMTAQVNALRSVEVLQNPEIVLAVDPRIQQELSNEDRQILLRFADDNKLTLLESRVQLAEALQTSVPDVLYLCGGAADDGLTLGDSVVTAEDLRAWLKNSEACQIPWNSLVVIANPVGSVDGQAWYKMKDQLVALRFGGLIYPETPLATSPAVRFGSEVLEGFVNLGESVGSLMQNKRSALAPHGLVYATACPPALETSWGEPATAAEVESDEESEEEPAKAARTASLPADPYRPLIPLDREDRALLVARDEHITAFAEVIDTSRTAVALLHGRPGVGKTSLLRSGVIPLLDDETPGYHALRDRTFDPDDEITLEKNHPVVAIRATNDPAGQLALALCAFAASPFVYSTPAGKTVVVDLPALLRQQVRGDLQAEGSTAITIKPPPLDPHIQSTEQSVDPSTNGEVPAPDNVEPVELRAGLMKDVSLFGRLLQAFCERLPMELVVLIEQGEELFSLSKTGADVKNRQAFMALLGALAALDCHAKIILSLRTEYFGRFLARLEDNFPLGMQPASYMLPSLNVNQLTQVILQPTLDEAIAYSEEIPAEKYGIRFSEHLPRKIALEALQAANQGHEEALPLVQVVCYLLYARVENRAERTIADDDLTAIGGVAGSIGRYVQRVLAALAPPHRRSHLKRMLQTLCLIQPDGLMTRDLVPEEDLLSFWARPADFDRILDAATEDELQLMHEIVTIHATGESTSYCLGHDALVPALEQMKETEHLAKHGRGRIIDTLFVVIPLAILLAVVVYVYVIVPRGRLIEEKDTTIAELVDTAKKQRVELTKAFLLQWPRYVGQMHQAHAAWLANDLVQMRRLLLAPKKQYRTELRGFEWSYLWHQANSERKTLVGHDLAVQSLALSADGELLLSTSAKKLLLWDMKDLVELSQSIPPTNAFRSVALSPDGSMAVTNFVDNTISLVPLKQPDSQKKLTGHDGPVTALVFTHDNKMLISASRDNTIRMWDVAKRKEAGVLAKLKHSLRLLALSPDDTLLAGVDHANKIVVWDVKKRKQLKIWGGTHNKLTALVFSPDSTTIACSESFEQENIPLGRVRYFDAKSGEEQGKALPVSTSVSAVLFAPDGKSLIAGCQDHTIRIWRRESGEQLHLIKGHLSAIRRLALSRDGGLLISGAADGTIKVWDLPPPPAFIRASDEWICCMDTSPDDRYAATGARDGTVKVWRIADGEQVKTLKMHKGPVTDVVFAKVGDKLLLASGDRGTANEPGQVLIWDVNKGSVEKQWTKFNTGVVSMAFTPNGATLVVSGRDETVRVWDVETGKVTFQLNGHKGLIHTLELAPNDNPMLAGGGDDQLVHLWDITTGTHLTSQKDDHMSAHTGPIRALAFYHTGGYIVSGSDDRTINLWHLKTHKLITTFRNHQGAVRALTFCLQGDTLASGDSQGHVKVWRLQLEIPVDEAAFTFSEHRGAVRDLRFSSDRRVLISAGHDGTVQIRRAAK